MRHLAPRFVLSTLLVGCSAAPNPPLAPTPTSSFAPSSAKSPPVGPPRWFLEVGTSWLEKTDSNLHRALAGIRFETRGRHIVGTATNPDELEGARLAPPWLSEQTACRYIFWRDRDVYAAATWLGEARKLGTVPTTVQTSFDWFDGVGLLTNSDMFVVRTSSCALEKLQLPTAAAASASSPRTAIVLTPLGRTRLTLDGAKSFRDATADLIGATGVTRVADELHVSTAGDRLFVIDVQGGIKATKRLESPPRDEPRADDDDLWPLDHAPTSALQAAVTNGLVLPNGDALVTDGGLVARVDLVRGRATEVLRAGSDGETCSPVALADRALLVCESGRRASVIDAGSGHVERSFDLEQEFVWDRFVAVDGEALGFLGSCAGRSTATAVDVVTSASPTNTSTQRSPTFCVRSPLGTWVEHQVEPADAADVVAWIPRGDGGAVAIVAPQGTYLHGVGRVDVRDSLRVIRVARNEPPLNISPYLSETPKLLSRALRALPDGSVEGWISAAHTPSSLMALEIDSQGRPKQRPLPARTSTMLTAGPFGIVRTEDGLYFETVDFGRHFRPIDPPPGKRTDPISMSEVGVQIGPFIRLGWGATAAAQTPETPSNSPPTQPPRAPPIVRLGCRFSGPTTSSRQSESYSVGFTKTPAPHQSPGRIASAGAFYVPWRGSPTPVTGDAEFIFVPFLDPAAPVRHATVPLSRLDPQQQVFHEIKLGFVLDGTSVLPVAALRFDNCPAALTDEAGLTVPFGTCVPDPTFGVNIDGRVTLIHQSANYYGQRPDSFVISTAELTKPQQGQTKLRGSNVKETATLDVPAWFNRYKMAVGRRGQTPVVVLLDGAGNARLATIDASRTMFGPDEPLVNLDKLQLATDARCAETPDDARVLLSFTTEIGFDALGLPGLRESEQGGIAILRWSNQHVCLEAIERTVHDERHELDMAFHGHGPVRKFISRFDRQNQGKGTLLLLTYGTELRQPITCDRVVP